MIEEIVVQTCCKIIESEEIFSIVGETDSASDMMSYRLDAATEIVQRIMAYCFTQIKDETGDEDFIAAVETIDQYVKTRLRVDYKNMAANRKHINAVNGRFSNAHTH